MIVDRHAVAVHGEPVGAGEARRAGADDSDRFVGRRGRCVELAALLDGDVGRVALQPADLDRPLLRGVAHAGFLAERLGRTDAGAHAAENVLVEDGLGRTDRIAGLDLADEQRNVDRGGTGRHARRVMAEVAAIRGHQRLMLVETRMQIGEILHIFGSVKPPGLEARFQSSHRSSLFFMVRLTTG